MEGASSAAAISSWKFDEGYGTTAYDEKGLNNGTLTSGPVIKYDDFCVSSKCLYFDGTDDYVVATDSASLDITGAMTISAWIRPQVLSTAQQIVVKDKDTATADRSYALYINSSNKVTLFVSQTSSASIFADTASNSSITRDDWYHVEAVFTPSTSVKIYINGKLDTTNTTSIPASIYSGAQNVGIGKRVSGTAQPFKGFIDDVKIYNYARTATEVAEDYISRGSDTGVGVQIGNASAGKTLSDELRGYWKFEEASYNGTTNEVKDSSGNSSTGTGISGATTTINGKIDRGVTLDGVNDYIDIQDSVTQDLFDFGTGDYTLSVWAKGGTQTNLNARYIMKYQAFYLNAQHTGVCSANKVVFEKPSGSAGLCSTSSLNDSNWHLITAVRKGDDAYLFIDGILEATGTGWSAESATSANTLTFSYPAADHYYAGTLDDVRIYGRALTIKEVRDLYNITNVYSTDPIANYKLDENTGTSTVYDSSRNLGSATMSGIASTAWVSGKSGSAIAFDGVNDYIQDTNVRAVNSAAGSISMWVRYTSADAAYKSIMTLYPSASGSTEWIEMYKASNNTLRFDYKKSSSNFVSSAAITRGTWYHLEGVWDATTSIVEFYVDGVSQGTDTTFTTIGDGLNTLNVGSFKSQFAGNSDYFPGDVDEVRIYNYARTPTQVIEDMYTTMPSSLKLQKSVLDLNMDNASGTTANDRSLYNNSFTLSSASWTTDGKFNSAWNGTGTLWMSRADDPDFDFTASQDFSITGWFKHNTASAAEVILNKEESTGADGGYRIQMESDGDITFGIDDDNTSFPEDSVTSTAATYDDNNWHHFAAVKKGTFSMKLYIDGHKVGTDDTAISATGTLVNDETMYIGDSNGADGGDEFIGSLDSIRIYRYALTPDQVASDYANNGSSVNAGALSTDSAGTAISNSAARKYCVPGDTTSCSAPVGDWPMDENTGTAIADISANANNGTATNGPVWSNGKFGSALTFDGTDDYISITDSTSLDTTSSAFTAEAWIYDNDVDDGTNDSRIIISKGDSASGQNNTFRVRIHDTKAIRLQIGDGTTSENIITTTSTVAYQTWTHVAATFNGTSANVYINGKLDTGPTSKTIGSLVNSGQLDIGRQSSLDCSTGFTCFNGKIDGVKLYAYARTPAQIAWDYNQGKPTGWYKLDECTGTTIYNSALGGNGLALGNDGTLTIGASGTNTSAGTCATSGAWFNGATGKRSSSINLDGTDDYISTFGTNISPVASRSICLWMKSTDPTRRQGLLGTRPTSASQGFAFHLNGTNSVRYYHTGGTNFAVTTTINAATWYHLCITYDTATSTANMYKDGFLIGNATSVTAESASTYTGIIGAEQQGATTELFSGSIDDVRIYNYPLTAQQILSIYNDGSFVNR